MKFDSRDKKPKLYNILILSIVVVLAIFLIARGAGNVLHVFIVLDVYLLAVFIMLLSAFFGQIHYNPYSYNTIFYMGFMLLDLSVLISHIVITIGIAEYPSMADEISILQKLSESAFDFMKLSFPVILVYSIALFVSNVSLIVHEGRRLVNILGIILSFLLLAGFFCYFLLVRHGSDLIDSDVVYQLLLSIYTAVYMYFECMILGAVVANVIAAVHEPEPDKDFVIILGCGFKKDGTPSNILKGRIERALEFYRRQKDLTGKDLIFVTSGGQGPDEVMSESECMKRYLIEKGIPEEQIIEEDRSTNTYENMKFSKEKIDAVNPDAKVAFSTTNYHVFRAGLFARRVKMRAVGMGAITKWYFWPNASVRELVGLLTEHKVKQLMIFGGMIALYCCLTLIGLYM